MAEDEQETPRAEQRSGGGAAEPASAEVPANDAEAASEGEATPEFGTATEDGPAYGSVRYTRRRVLILGGAFAAGLAAVIAGVKAFGGSAADKVGGAITDQFGPFPIRSVDPVPDVPPEKWVVKVDGLVDTPLTLDRAAWTGLQRMDETVDFHCVEGWTVDNVRWGGVAPTVLLDTAGVKPEAKYAIFHAYGGVYLSSLPLALISDQKTMLADSLNGGPLPPKHGGPLRLVVPKQLGYKNVKWVERIELSDKLKTGYWEANGYPEDAPAPGS
jgi:hypothetical protein